MAFNYPPAPNVGSLRPAKFAKYLPQFGFEPYVLTKSSPSHRSEHDQEGTSHVYQAWYPTLRLEISRGPSEDGSEGQGSSASSPSRTWRERIGLTRRTLSPWIDFPDPAIRWYPFAVRAGLQLLKATSINVILSTSGPATAHLVASTLAHRAKIPWVADYRDPWNANPYRAPRPLAGIGAFELRLERRVLSRAAGICTTSDTYAAILERVLDRPAVVIPNGFDEEDLPSEIPLLPNFTITYTGEINDLRVRNPEPLFQALNDLIRRQRIEPDSIRLRFFGNTCALLKSLVEKYALSNIVEINRRLEHPAALARQAESTVLLNLDTGGPVAQGGIGVKTYEYLASGRPILALAPPNGDIAELLRQTGRGMIANTPAEISPLILNWMDAFRQGRQTSYPPNSPDLVRYSRRTQAGQMASVLKCAIEKGAE